MKRLLITFAISVSLFSQVPFPGGSSGGGGSSSSSSPNPVPALTWDNQSTSTVSDVNGTEQICSPNTSGSGLNARFITAPATPYNLTVRIIINPVGIGSARQFGVNLLFRESSTGKLVGLGLNVNSSGGTFLSIDNWTSAAVFSSSPFANTATSWNPLLTWSAPSFIYLRERDDGTNISFYYSFDGNNFFQVSTNLSRTAFMLTGPNQIAHGISLSTTGASVCNTIMSWTTS